MTPSLHSTPYKNLSVSHAVQISALCVVQAAPVAGVQPVQVHVLGEHSLFTVVLGVFDWYSKALHVDHAGQ